MSETVIRDADGFELKAFNYHDYLILALPNIEERMKRLPDFPVRDTDVFLCTYPKSGAHWSWEVISMLLRRSSEYMAINMGMEELCAFDEDYFDQLSSPRVLHTHLLFRYLPRGLAEKRNKIVLAARNPKDVAVSYYQHLQNMSIDRYYNGSWDGFFHLYLEGKVPYGNWIDYILQWERDIMNNPEIPVYILMYEDLHGDPIGKIKDLAKFLGVKADESLYNEIADKCSFAKLKEAKPKYSEMHYKTNHASIFRKGAVGDWKNWFTVEQNQLYDKEFKIQMKHSKFRFLLE